MAASSNWIFFFSNRSHPTPKLEMFQWTPEVIVPVSGLVRAVWGWLGLVQGGSGPYSVS